MYYVLLPLGMRATKRTLTYVDNDISMARALRSAKKPRTELSSQQRARRHWNSMVSRVKTKPYVSKGIEIHWTYGEFEEWFCSDVNQARIDAILMAGETPSIDRIDSSGNYSKDNCRIIPTKLNRALGEVNALVSRMKTLQAYLRENEHWLT